MLRSHVPTEAIRENCTPNTEHRLYLYTHTLNVLQYVFRLHKRTQCLRWACRSYLHRYQPSDRKHSLCISTHLNRLVTWPSMMRRKFTASKSHHNNSGGRIQPRCDFSPCYTHTCSHMYLRPLKQTLALNPPLVTLHHVSNLALIPQNLICVCWRKCLGKSFVLSPWLCCFLFFMLHGCNTRALCACSHICVHRTTVIRCACVRVVHLGDL